MNGCQRGALHCKTCARQKKGLYLLVQVLPDEDACRGGGGVPGPLRGPRHEKGFASHQRRLLLDANVALRDLHATRLRASATAGVLTHGERAVSAHTHLVAAAAAAVAVGCVAGM